MPASSIMTYFDDCETDGLSSSSCTIFFFYTTVRKSSIYMYIVITNVSQKLLFAYLLLVTMIFISFNY